MSTYTNNDSLEITIGVPGGFEGGQLRTQGATKELKIIIDPVNGFPDANAKNEGDSFVPANSHIVSSVLKVTEAFVGGTSVGLGYDELDGTTIDADGIDVAIATAAINAIGKSVVCDGALSTGITVGSDAAYPTSTIVGTYTAGKAELYITYIG